MYLQCEAHFVVAEYISQLVERRCGTECEDTDLFGEQVRHTDQSGEFWLIFCTETKPDSEDWDKL